MTASGEVVWRAKAALAIVESADRIVVLDLDRLADPPLVLMGTAAAIWTALDGQRTTPDIVQELAAEFGVDAAEIEPDVENFVRSLSKSGLLEVVQ